MSYPDFFYIPPVSVRPAASRLRLLTDFVAVLFVFVVLTAVTAPRAGAVSDGEELTSFGGVGAGAGQLTLERGIASDPVTGDVYTAESAGTGGNNRISEFTPWGEFVKAFGWDVAPAGVNERQEVRVRAAAGQFRLRLGAESSGDLSFDAKASEVQAAVGALGSVGAGNVTVEAVNGTADGATPFIYVVAFRGALAATDVAQLEAVDGTTPLSGGVPSSSLVVRTLVDGHAATAGLESCTKESGCKAGLRGEGAGQFSVPWGVAVDAGGDVYVREFANDRVQKFDSAGRFLLMFGGDVDQGPHHPGDVCSAADVAEGDSCGAGSEGAGAGEFAKGLNVAVGAGGTVFLPDKERIEEFEPDGAFKGEVKIPGETVGPLAVNPKSGGFYAVFASSEGPKDDVRAVSSAGALEGTCKVKDPGALASDASGRLFVVGRGEDGVERVFEFEAGCGSGEALGSLAEAEFLPGSVTARFTLSGLGTNGAGDLYVANSSPVGDSFIRAFGPGPVGFESAPEVAPTISAQFTSAAWSDGATVGALINPHFWTDTRYFVQYGTGNCSEGGCGEQAPVSPGLLLSSKVSSGALPSADVALDGLKAGTTYHYRFVAQSGGGGPVFGIDPDGPGPLGASAEAGLEGTFTTPEPLPPGSSCANDALRIGASALLPDCRAFEMVSPLDKNNGDVKALVDATGDGTDLPQSAAGGERFTYSSSRSFGDPEGAPYTSQYVASRDPERGWSSEAVDVSQAASDTVQGPTLENPYKAFSADLCEGWLVVTPEPLLDPGRDFEGYPNVYRRQGCGAGKASYEALMPLASQPSREPVEFNPELQGTSADGRDAVLRVREKLSPEAASGVWQAYYAGEGQLRALCVAPGGTASGGNCSVGTGGSEKEKALLFPELHRTSSVAGAVSSDGSRVYWTDSGVVESGPGKVYLRENPGAEQSVVEGGECTEPDKACTLAVSGTVTSEAARFLGASPEGARALFEVTEGPAARKLYEFEVGSGSSEIAGKVLGVAAMSKDLSRVYFVSEEALGGGGSAGKANLYLEEGGSETFIATLSKTDVESGGFPSDTSPEPVYHAARVSPDGGTLSFISTEPLTGYDNTDQQSGKADSEVYVYEAGAAGPVCVSCDPSGARPRGRVVQGAGNSPVSLATAGSLPMAETDLHVPRALSGDGRRLFFDTFDALVPRDTNGAEDVYEWESAPSSEACEEKGAELYVAAAAGCLSLISSGASPLDSEFLDASETGDDVFFSTGASLLPSDTGLIDVYDARVDGGFPQATRPTVCEGEACQGAFIPPPDTTPSSLVFSGPGNLAPLLTAPAKPTVKPSLNHCRKGMVRKQARCVKKKHPAHKGSVKNRKAGKSSRAAARRNGRTGR